MSIKIRTQRNYQTWPSWDLVYEWEDVLAKELKGSFVYESKYLAVVFRISKQPKITRNIQA